MSATYIHKRTSNSFLKYLLGFLALLYFVALFGTVFYLWQYTQDRYITTAAFKISKQDAATSSTGLSQVLLPGMADSGAMDSQVVIGYMDSVELLLELEKEFDLIKHYSAPKQDFVYRLEADAPLEDRLEYYRSRITAHFGKETGLTMLSVDTFDPVLSQKVAASVLRKAEAFVNHINQSIADQQLEFIRGELDRSSKHVEDLTKELLKLQNDHRFISPDEAITANLAAVRELQMERLRLEAEIASLVRDSPGSPTIDPLRSRLRSLNELIDVEAAKVSGPEMNRLNQILVQFKELQQKIDFAVELRSGAQSMLEKNRVEAISRSRFFSVIQNPFLPEDAALPRRPYGTATIFSLGFLVFLILRALTRSVFDRS
jgi:capsular polysaccharide transport system permease protein